MHASVYFIRLVWLVSLILEFFAFAMSGSAHYQELRALQAQELADLARLGFSAQAYAGTAVIFGGHPQPGDPSPGDHDFS